MSDILNVVNVEKYYHGKKITTKAVDNISFNVQKGEFMSIMGASGSGKTTLLNCISTIDKVTGGKIFINNEDITTIKSAKLSKFRREQLGFIFQDFNLLDTLTGFENIAIGLTIKNTPKNLINEKIYNLATFLDVKNVLNKYPVEMSGGQKQRIAALRAIVTEPSLILADEPTGALDSRSSRVLLESLTKINKELMSTILMVTHDAYATSFSNRVIFIKDGKMFNEIIKGNSSKKEFFDKIMNVITLLGGDIDD